jgi:hypothetical protein
LVLGLFTAGELLDETLGSAAGFGNEGDGRVIVGSGTTRAETGHGSISVTIRGPQAAAAGSGPSA